MKHIQFSLLFFAFLVFTPNSVAQKQKVENPEKAIKTVVNRFFEGIEKGDTTLLKSSCTATMLLQTFTTDKEGKMQVYTEEFADFLAMVGSPNTDNYQERIKFEAIHVEKSLASVWTPYTFYINDKRSHCGTNSFQLVNTAGGWKIQYIIDARRKQGCE